MIINFSLNKVIMEKKELQKSPEKIETKNRLKINGVSEQLLAPISKEKALKFDFTFGVKYEPNVASVDIEGSILFMTDEAKSKEILDKWKKEKKLNAVLSENIVNFILAKCNVRVLQWAQELNLPPHIPFPRIVASNAEEK